LNYKTPRDIQGHNAFRSLALDLGEVGALYLLHKLFVELAYQSGIHGKVGLFDRGELPVFIESISPLKLDHNAAIVSLLKAKILVPEGDNWFCSIFAECNPELDVDYIHPANTAKLQFNRRKQAIEKQSAKLVERLPPEAWLAQDGSRVLPLEMNRALNFIKTLDNICAFPERRPEEFEIGLIHDACRLAGQYDPKHLDVILRRIYLKRKSAAVPKHPQGILRNFHHLVLTLFPDQGYVKWDKIS
jgi:hypothetical protein